MIDDTTTRIIEKLNDVTNSLTRFEITKDELKSIALEKNFMEIQEVEGESIIALTITASKSHDPSKTKIIAINVDVKNRDSKEIKFKVKGENIKGKNITKNYIIAQILHKFHDLKEKDIKEDILLLFYCWIPSFSKLKKILEGLIDVKSLAWLVEPTSFYICPVEKGFGKLNVDLKPPASLKPRLNEIFQEIKKEMNAIYKPAHDIYPTEGLPQLINAFLPGAPSVKLSGTDYENTLDRSSINFSIMYNFIPFDDKFLNELIANIKDITKKVDENIVFKCEPEFHFPGAKSTINNDLFQEVKEAHCRVFGKEPYIEWHIHQSIASVLNEISSESRFLVYGPGDPFLLGKRKEALPGKHAQAFQEILDIII
ncbi:MAG: hypothetical protein ACFFCS_08095 [Candidatus Hodarchaeota archaeon]